MHSRAMKEENAGTPGEHGWLPVHDTAAVWANMWRQFRSYESPDDPDYHARRGTYGRGVLWAYLPDHATIVARLHMRMMTMPGRTPQPKEWWRK